MKTTLQQQIDALDDVESMVYWHENGVIVKPIKEAKETLLAVHIIGLPLVEHAVELRDAAKNALHAFEQAHPALLDEDFNKLKQILKLCSTTIS